jgi:hypothetical protein
MIKSVSVPVLLWFMCYSGYAVATDSEIEILLAKPFVKAEFSKSRKLKILSKPFNTSGKILFLPDKGLVWQTVKPIDDILLIGGNGISQMKKEGDTPVEITNPIVQSASRIFLSIFSLELDKIKEIFEIQKSKNMQDKSGYILIPKEESLRKIIKSIELSGKQRVEQIYIEEVSGDSTRVWLDNEQFDKSVLSASELSLLELL